MAMEATVRKQKEEGYWKCLCGRLNPPYSSGCECGLTVSEIRRIKSENSKKAFEQLQLEKKEAEEVEKAEAEKKATENVSNEKNNISLLKEYKDLLDSGIISQEDFDKKKSELLKL